MTRRWWFVAAGGVAAAVAVGAGTLVMAQQSNQGSGTTFLGSCVGRMPEVSYHFEPRLTKAAARCVYDGSWSERRCATVFRVYYASLLLAGLHGGRRFAEKNPENSFIVPFLAQVFPDAQFVHIMRDGRDAAVSHAEQPWLAAASAGSGRRGRGGQLWGPSKNSR